MNSHLQSSIRGNAVTTTGGAAVSGSTLSAERVGTVSIELGRYQHLLGSLSEVLIRHEKKIEPVCGPGGSESGGAATPTPACPLTSVLFSANTQLELLIRRLHDLTERVEV